MALKTIIIVLNWNGLHDTTECVESLEKITLAGCEIIVVDNGSTDGSAGILKKRFPGIEILETGKNLGFTGGMNAGIKYALKAGAQYIILLNNDTVVDPEFAGELVRAAGERKRAGIVCSKVLFYDRPGVINYAGAWFNTWLGWGRLRGFNKADGPPYDLPGETDRASGCSMMVTRDFVEKTGLLDEKFFCYCEDTDWSLRARAAGFKILFVPSSKVWHKESRSTGGRVTALSLYYNVRNTLYCLDKNRPVNPALNILRIASVTLTSLLSLFTMRIPKRRGLKFIYLGLRDYLRGKTGEFQV